ncbi:MAG: Xaa-Pro peptidase family protein [Lentisphaerota bacterium]
MKKLTGPRLMISAASDASDVLYATGFAAVDPVAFLDDGKHKYLLVPALELGRARESSPGVTVLTPEDLHVPRAQRRKMSSWILALLNEKKIRRALVSAVFPFGTAQRLQKKGLRVVLSLDPAYPGRQIKTEEEIKKMRASQKAAVAAMRCAIHLIHQARPDRRGLLKGPQGTLTSESVRGAIDLELLRHRCSGAGTIVACGHDSFNPHSHGHGPLRKDTPIVIDIFPQHRETHYWGDLTRTVVKGRAPDALRAMHAAVKDAQRAALRTVRHGAQLAEVHGAVEDLFAKRGFETLVKNGVAEGFIHSTGHGVGLDIHEAPSIRRVEGRLRAGNVVTVEPGLYYPDMGGVRIEDTIVVTKTGWVSLAPLEERLEV